MVNQLISMAAWKGMSQKNFPLWTLLNAYNQQPDRLLEMQRAGFFPSEQGPIPLGGQAQLMANNNQPVQFQTEDGKVHSGTLYQPGPKDHLDELKAEVNELKVVVSKQTEGIDKLLKFSQQQNNRILELESKQIV